ncbi:MAG: peptidylprolyl isomerase [Candidatus Omnitrophota bacterium]
MSIDKKMSVFIVLVLTLFLILSQQGEAAEKFAAKVNGVGIKNITMEAAMTNFIENQKFFGVEVKEEEKGKLKEDILNELISAELLYQRSKEAKLGDLEKEISDQLESMRKGFGSEENFKKVLSERNISINDLKDDIRKGIYITNFLEKEIYSKINITEEDKKKEFEANRERLAEPEKRKVQHILLRTDPSFNEVEKSLAIEELKGLRERALKGEDFRKLAIENSEDNSSTNGGEIDYFSRDEVVKSFGDTAFSMKKDEVSEVVESEFGYHLIKLLDIKPARDLSYEEVKEDLGRYLLTLRRKEVLDTFVEGLKKEAKITVY